MESTATTAKTNFLFILTAPRSLSTVFLRSFLENPSVTVFNDSVTTCKQGNLSGTIEEKLQHLEDSFDETIRMGKTVVLKDIAFIVNEYFETFRRWNRKYNMKFMYLVRHPTAQYASFVKAITYEKKLQRLPDSLWDSQLRSQKYKPVWDAYQEFNGHIVVAEDLQRDPQRVLKQAFEYADIEFNNRYLQFEKLIDKGVPEDWKIWQHWYTECLNSTSIRSNIPDPSTIKLESEDAIKQVAESQEYYLKFLSAAAAANNSSIAVA